jgi:hypothetical protein
MQNYFYKPTRMIMSMHSLWGALLDGEVIEAYKLLAPEEKNDVKTLKFEPLLQMELDIVVQPGLIS